MQIRRAFHFVHLWTSHLLAGCSQEGPESSESAAPQDRGASESAADRNPSAETMFRLPVAQRLSFAFEGFAGHSVAKMPTKPPMLVKAAITAEMSMLQPILKLSAVAVFPSARGHSTVPAVMKTPTAAAKPTRPATSKPHFTSLSFRFLACQRHQGEADRGFSMGPSRTCIYEAPEES